MPRPPGNEAISSHNPNFSLYDSLWMGMENERMFSALDLGPTDSLTPDQLEQEYDLFFGSSPLSSPASSRSASIRSRSASPCRVSLPPTHSSANPSPLSIDKEAPLSGKARKRKRRHEKRRIARQKAREEGYEKKTYLAHPTILNNHVKSSTPIETDFDTGKIPACSTGFTSLRQHEGGIYTANELVDKQGFKLILWDGRESRPVVDSEKRIVGALIGKPNCADWENVARGAFEAIRKSSKRCKFPRKAQQHRRGNFPALSVGISHGGGQQKPGNLHHSKTNERELQKLLQNKHIRRIAGHSSAAFATWGPKLFKYYLDHFDALLQSDPNLIRNFTNSVWASAAINYGPRTVAERHLDYANLPFGWCSITALGDFNPKKGGHIVLWALKLVIEFPPGSTVLITSAAVEHSNTPISRRETRCSFTQYTAGGIFRWVSHKCQKTEDYLAGLRDDEREMELKEREERCKLGLSLFSTIDELLGGSVD